MKTEALQKQNSIELEPFYQALEDDPMLLEEAFETLLEMVNSEPKTAKKLALVIKDVDGIAKNRVAFDFIDSF